METESLSTESAIYILLALIFFFVSIRFLLRWRRRILHESRNERNAEIISAVFALIILAGMMILLFGRGFDGAGFASAVAASLSYVGLRQALRWWFRYSERKRDL